MQLDMGDDVVGLEKGKQIRHYQGLVLYRKKDKKRGGLVFTKQGLATIEAKPLKTSLLRTKVA